MVAALLLLGAVGLLVGGLAQGSAALQWASFAASALAALVLALGEFRRRRAAADQVSSAPASVTAPAAAGPPGPVSTGMTAPEAHTPSTATGRAPLTADPVPPVAAAAAARPAGPATGAHAAAPPTGPTTGAHTRPPTAGPSTGAHAAMPSAAPVLGPDGEPPAEEVEVTDLLLVLDLSDEVLVVDEHPRYHLAGCPHLSGVDPIPMPMDEARTDGFTPCGACAPDRNLAERERSRRAGR
jgi:hypothetical protein